MTSFTIAETIIHTATKLTTLKGRRPYAEGTGFFYDVHVGPEGNANLLITNKHVFEGAEAMTVTFHVRSPTANEPTGEIIQWEFDIRPFMLTPHPDPEVDLCCINIAVPLQEMQKHTGKRAFFCAAGRANLPTADQWADFDAVEEVMMVGCPNGIFDAANNIPIVRRGVTATSLTRLYNGRQQFMVDMACFPGSSGSPVWMFDDDGYRDRKTGQWKEGAQRLFLVGVLYAGPVISADGGIHVASGSVPGAMVEVRTPMHLGYCVRATQIAALEDVFLKVRAEAVARMNAKK